MSRAYDTLGAGPSSGNAVTTLGYDTYGNLNRTEVTRGGSLTPFVANAELDGGVVDKVYYGDVPADFDFTRVIDPKLGTPVTHTDPNGHSHSFAHDPLARVAKVDPPPQRDYEPGDAFDSVTLREPGSTVQCPGTASLDEEGLTDLLDL